VTNTVRQPRRSHTDRYAASASPTSPGERKAVAVAALAAHADLTLAPVQILKLQARDLVRPQTESREQHQDREVPRPDQGRPVTTRQQPLNIGAGDRLGNSGAPSFTIMRQILGGSPQATDADPDAAAAGFAQSPEMQAMFELLKADQDGAQGEG
jgi:hypothetical protein